MSHFTIRLLHSQTRRHSEPISYRAVTPNVPVASPSFFKQPVVASSGSKSGISKAAMPATTKDETATSTPAPAKKTVDINEPQTCRNKGCGKTFKEKDNSETACEYHPGPPIFHDRMRGWKCCDVHVKEFDEFMSIPPCTKGWHNADA